MNINIFFLLKKYWKLFFFYLILFQIILIFWNWKIVKGITRPIWDIKWKKTQLNQYKYIIPNYGFIEGDEEFTCKIHGFELLEKEKRNSRVFHCILFSNELDLLEIQINELYSIVDYFIIVESPITFRGKSKPLILWNNRERFSKFWSKIVYISLDKVHGEPKGFNFEIQHRNHFYHGLNKAGIKEGDWVIISDADEIIRKNVIQIILTCKTPSSIQLDLSTSSFQYSFEFKIPVVANTWTRQPTNIIRWRSNIAIKHNIISEWLFVDAGWHCSWCFPYIEDYLFKMTSYSHSFLDNPNNYQYINPKWIQHAICNGIELNEDIQEKWTFREVISVIGSLPSHFSIMDIPEYIQKNPKKFLFLLPGYCNRSMCGTTGCKFNISTYLPPSFQNQLVF